jgi:hypothetical protein
MKNSPVLTEWTRARSGNGYGPIGISLGAPGSGANNRVLSLYIRGGKVIFAEGCDGYFELGYAPEDAKRVLREALAWIDSQTTGG